ncbi:MAG: hypothetical protein ISN28_00540 [Ectothiorhodospiraceae bacterium AqS1]|nr:hypothetical protein [Ectothiorhodospiraceae bacterium AqS1]
MDEFEIIDRFFKGRTESRCDTLLGIGDDAAILATGGRRLVSEMAALNPMPAPTGDRGIDRGQDEGALAARALFAQALLRLALRRIAPRWATLALSVERIDGERSAAWLESFAAGMEGICRACKVELIGGDTTRGANRIVVFAHGLSPKQAKASTPRQGPAAQAGIALAAASDGGRLVPSGAGIEPLRLGLRAFSVAAVSDLIALCRSPVAEGFGRALFRGIEDPDLGSSEKPLVAAIDIRCDEAGKEALRSYAAKHIEVIELP